MRANGGFYLASFVGVLGWLDAPFRHGYYNLSLVMFSALFLATVVFAGVQNPARPADRASALAAFAASVGMVFASLYLTWTPVGNAIVEGVQGRYFLPLAPILALALSPVGTSVTPGVVDRGRIASLVRAACVGIVLSFPFVTFVELINLVVNRWYL
jgi:uncharacterized membrane protein